MTFQEYDTVRVTQLLAPKSVVSSSFDPPRVPVVGDEGVVIDLPQGEYGVESVDADGYTRWFAYFRAEELTLVDRLPRG